MDSNTYSAQTSSTWGIVMGIYQITHKYIGYIHISYIKMFVRYVFLIGINYKSYGIRFLYSDDEVHALYEQVFTIYAVYP